jgi:nitrite reductase (NADH) small subunit
MNAPCNTAELENWATVCRFDDLIDNIGVCALVEDKQIAIFRLSGSKQLYAIDNHDPLSNANVLARGMCGDLKGQAVVASPIYKQHFILSTGQCLEDESIVLRTFAIRIVDGFVQVEK